MSFDKQPLPKQVWKPIPFDKHDNYELFIEPRCPGDGPSTISIQSALGHDGVKSLSHHYNRGTFTGQSGNPKIFYKSSSLRTPNLLTQAVIHYSNNDTALFGFFDEELVTNDLVQKEMAHGRPKREAQLLLVADKIVQFLTLRTEAAITVHC